MPFEPTKISGGSYTQATDHPVHVRHSLAIAGEMLVENAGGIQFQPRATSRCLLKDYMGIPLMGVSKSGIECVVVTPIVALTNPSRSVSVPWPLVGA